MAPEQKTAEQIRADARQRKRDQRERDSAILEELHESSMDDGQKRIRRIMAKIAEEPRQPHKVIAWDGVPIPTRLPTLAESLRFMKSIPQSEAIRKGNERYEAAMHVGAISLDDYEQLRLKAYDTFGHCSPEAILAVGQATTETQELQ